VAIAGLLCCAFPAILVLYAIIDALVIQPARARVVLAGWAEDNALALQEAVRNWGSGPFGLALLDSRVVFRIAVIDAEGRRRAGFARAGYKWLGFFSPAVEVRWTEETGQAGPSA
jgi:hypothetical protein